MREMEGALNAVGGESWRDLICSGKNMENYMTPQKSKNSDVIEIGKKS